MVTKPDKNQNRLRRHKRVRGKISGSAALPRLCVYRSLKNITAQIIDDDAGKTLVAAASNEKGFDSDGGNKEGAKQLGLLIGKRALENGIENVVFDRGGYVYHGRVQSLADGAREAGLKF